jgi:hypothetical protein
MSNILYVAAAGAAELAGTKPEDLAVSAVSIIGPRNKVAKLVKDLSLLR